MKNELRIIILLLMFCLWAISLELFKNFIYKNMRSGQCHISILICFSWSIANNILALFIIILEGNIVYRSSTSELMRTFHNPAEMIIVFSVLVQDKLRFRGKKAMSKESFHFMCRSNNELSIVTICLN